MLSILNHLLIEVDGSGHIFFHLAANLRHQALITHKGMEANPAITDGELVTAVTGVWEDSHSCHTFLVAISHQYLFYFQGISIGIESDMCEQPLRLSQVF